MPTYTTSQKISDYLPLALIVAGLHVVMLNHMHGIVNLLGNVTAFKSVPLPEAFLFFIWPLRVLWLQPRLNAVRQRRISIRE